MNDYYSAVEKIQCKSFMNDKVHNPRATHTARDNPNTVRTCPSKLAEWGADRETDRQTDKATTVTLPCMREG